jgi:AAHS family cis,cis-muconate transporter-like MFS transporter
MVTDSLDRTGRIVVIGVFVALVVDGLDMQALALALPSISQEFKVSGVMAGALATYTLLGMGIGGIVSGRLADRVGRVRVTWWSVFTFTVCTASIALCREYWEIAVMRFLSGFGIAAVYSVGTLLAAEYVPTRIRSTVLGTLQAGWSLGNVLAAALAAVVIPRLGWRPLFVCGVVPGIVALIMLTGLPDPPSFCASRAVGGGAVRPSVVATLWTDPRVRRTFILWTLTSIAFQFGFFGASTWLPSYLVSDLHVDLQRMGWYVAGTYTMMVLGKVVTGYLADQFGRRVMWVIPCLLTAGYLPMLVYAATPTNVAVLLLICGFLYGAPYALTATYMSESFPVSVRGTAVGTSYNLGRIGSTLSPLLIGIAATYASVGVGIALLGVAYAVCAVIPGTMIREKMFDPQGIERVPPNEARSLPSRGAGISTSPTGAAVGGP